MKKRKNLYAVIPAHNEQRHIGDVLKRTLPFCKHIVVVDDGSTDFTAEIAARFPITLISIPVNQGKGNALRKGVEYAISQKASAIVILDSDGQHRPEHIPRFVKALNNTDLAIGTRIGNDSIPFARKFGNRLAALIIYLLTGLYVKDLLCGYRAFTPRAYEKIKWRSSGYGVETEMIVKSGRSNLRVAEVEVENIYLDQFKGVTLIDALAVFISLPKYYFLK